MLPHSLTLSSLQSALSVGHSTSGRWGYAYGLSIDVRNQISIDDCTNIILFFSLLSIAIGYVHDTRTDYCGYCEVLTNTNIVM